MSNEHDTFPVWKLSAQQQIDDYREEVKILKAENTKLRQELEAVGTAAYLYGRTDLADDNAKQSRAIAISDYNDGIIPEPCLRLDYGFGQEYASVELGDGTGYVRVTDELRGEYYKMQSWYDDELKVALADNAKLQKMVCALLQCRVEDKDICSKCDCRSPLHGGCMADVMADKLGIEVDK